MSINFQWFVTASQQNEALVNELTIYTSLLLLSNPFCHLILFAIQFFLPVSFIPLFYNFQEEGRDSFECWKIARATMPKINFFREKCLKFIRYNKLTRFRDLQTVFEDMSCHWSMKIKFLKTVSENQLVTKIYTYIRLLTTCKWSICQNKIQVTQFIANRALSIFLTDLSSYWKAQYKKLFIGTSAHFDFSEILYRIAT